MPAMSDFTRVMRKTTIKQFQDNNGRVRPREIYAEMWQKHPEVLEAERDKLLENGAINKITHFLKSYYGSESAEADGAMSLQMGLPGLPAPAAIAVKEGTNEYAYVLFESATWEDLNTGALERDENIDNAIASREDWSLKMAYLGPVMKGTGRTVREAIEIMQKRAA
jgi:hypothetical protein